MKRSNKKRLQKAASAAMVVAMAASSMSTAFAADASACLLYTSCREIRSDRVQSSSQKI